MSFDSFFHGVDIDSCDSTVYHVESMEIGVHTSGGWGSLYGS